ncbi:Ccc1 family [Microdochium trichocladiopsis]|uniref:Ccc1 family n=1 Tax=Microdochium trichocladiopsis TaxID=1682393 RepID=A0A9P8YCA4_9PEZI|nr:Ccc1 family [Microdochium trichocladiopsis]KAH7033674.1 Ccc1 family [Microdochium trichocladiopsis]
MSFLDRSDAVILAGLAELCAGSISMGIGGFLAMRDTQRQDEPAECQDEDEEGSTGQIERRHRQHGDDADGAAAGLLRHQEEGRSSTERPSTSSSPSDVDSIARLEKRAMEEDSADEQDEEEAIRRHLAPLQLPEPAIQQVLAAMGLRSTSAPGFAIRDPATTLQQRLSAFYASQSTHAGRYYDAGDEYAPPLSTQARSTILAPVVSGLTIALGYVIGGLIPLLPYFFAETVEVGTRWSIALCMVALFGFGSGKCWALQGLLGGARNRSGHGDEHQNAGIGKTMWRCIFEGVQMLVLGMVAAGAAVLCVQLVNERETNSP